MRLLFLGLLSAAIASPPEIDHSVPPERIEELRVLALDTAAGLLAADPSNVHAARLAGLLSAPPADAAALDVALAYARARATSGAPGEQVRPVLRAAAALASDDAASLQKVAAISARSLFFDVSAEANAVIAERWPSHTALHNLAVSLDRIGDDAGSIDALERAVPLAAGPDEVCLSRSLQVRLLLGMAGEDMDRAAAVAADALAQPLSEDGDCRVQTLFHFGKVRERQGRFAEAFALWREANALQLAQPGVMEYAVEVVETLTSPTQLWAPDKALALLSRPPTPTDGPTPVFIVGMPRSGTSLLHDMLAAHPAVTGVQESRAMQRVVDRVFELMQPEDTSPADALLRLSDAQLDALGALYLGAMPAGAQFTVDKMPYNFANLGFIAAGLPAARVIHLRREPRAVALSMFSQRFSAAINNYAYSLDGIDRVGRASRRMVRHWAGLGAPVIDVAYEALVQDPERQLRRIADFVGLEFAPEMLDHTSGGGAAPMATASYKQVRQPLYTTSLSRWRNFEGELEGQVSSSWEV